MSLKHKLLDEIDAEEKKRLREIIKKNVTALKVQIDSYNIAIAKNEREISTILGAYDSDNIEQLSLHSNSRYDAYGNPLTGNEVIRVR